VNQKNGPTTSEHAPLVLIVDDEKALTQVIAKTLEVQGFQTAIACNGPQALEMASRLLPGIILLDVMLPGQSGFEVCTRLKHDPLTAHIPVVFLTAKSDLASRTAGIAAGADAYLTKPFSPLQLIELIRDALAGQLAKPGVDWPSPSPKSDKQWEVYARELSTLYRQEQAARQELAQALQRLERLSRIQSEFLGVITHELLTPFGNIGLILEVIQRLFSQEAISDECRTAMDNLATEIAKLHRMISGVVKFAELLHKQREPNLSYIDLAALIPPAVEPVAIMAQARQVDFRCIVPPDLPPILADATLLSEAVFQMAHNAVKFNRPGGYACVRASQSAEWMLITVEDTGIGLSGKLIASLGQPFKQRVDSLRRGQEGLGIGWAFVGYVAQAHSGWLKVHSDGPGKGSTFILAFPIVPQEK